MSDVAFETLGVPRTATEAEVRRAFRREALRHHPDHNPDDPRAPIRFKRVLSAYRVALRHAIHGENAGAPPPVGPRPDRFECAGCGDCFPFREPCSRCGLDLWDRTAGPAVRRDSPEVAAMIEDLESRPEPGPSLAERWPLTGMIVSGSLAAAFFAYQVGPIGIAMLLAGFAAYVTALEAARRVSTYG